MQIDLRTVSIKPLRQTFDHIAKRFGADKPATRYQEGTYDLQATHNFHYRPSWDPERELFDVTRTALKMKDWYAFKDPRQYYYGTYTSARARQQEAAEANFDFVEQRGLADALDPAIRSAALEILVPLRHVAWGGNMNNAFMCAYGYGTAITQPCIYQSMDHLGIAQYLTRVGLAIGSQDELKTAKQAWLEAPMWQEMRHVLEDTFVLKDWFELFVVQNLLLDGTVYPLVYDTIVDDEFTVKGGTAVALLTRFMTEWYAETSKWVDAEMKIAVAESPENAALIAGWIAKWKPRVSKAAAPLAQRVFGDRTADVMADIEQQLVARLNKLGIKQAA
jgi:phenol hydroxylase P1 protein